jgi:hypothetical protein
VERHLALSVVLPETAMSYDEMLARVPDTDDCTDDAETCECRECREWRDNREPAPMTFDEALAMKLAR